MPLKSKTMTGDLQRPPKNTADQLRPANTTWTPKEITGDQQIPTEKNVKYWGALETSGDKQRSLETVARDKHRPLKTSRDH